MSQQGSVEDLDLLLVDGDNLLHDVRGSRDEGGVAWLLPRLRVWRPQHLRIVVGLDGHPPPGEASRVRASRGIEFHHSGRRSADDLLMEVLAAQPYASRARTAVVTRDRGLQARATRAGGLTRSIDWLMRQVAGTGTGGRRSQPDVGRPVGIGQGKPPRSQPHAAAEANDDQRSWEPGRGATRKKGNPRRSAKRSRRR